MSNFLISQIINAHVQRLEAGVNALTVAADLRKFSDALSPPLCTTSALEDQCYEDACIEAAEICGPNSHEYESLVEAISERLLNERTVAEGDIFSAHELKQISKCPA